MPPRCSATSVVTYTRPTRGPANPRTGRADWRVRQRQVAGTARVELRRTSRSRITTHRRGAKRRAGAAPAAAASVSTRSPTRQLPTPALLLVAQTKPCSAPPIASACVMVAECNAESADRVCAISRLHRCDVELVHAAPCVPACQRACGPDVKSATPGGYARVSAEPVQRHGQASSHARYLAIRPYCSPGTTDTPPKSPRRRRRHRPTDLVQAATFGLAPID